MPEGVNVDLDKVCDCAADKLMASLGVGYNDTKIKDPGLEIPGCGGGCTMTDPIGPNGGRLVHAARAGTGPELKPGMFFTIEPMINIGKPHAKVLDDGWTAVTRDRSLSAQFEHSIGITDDGCEIFTASPKGLHKPPY